MKSTACLLAAILLSLSFFTTETPAQECTISAPSETVTSPIVELSVNCPGAPFFKLSESPDFQESVDTGVSVSIDYIDPLGEFADVSIRYPNGIDGGNATPFAVNETTREVRVLAVLFTFGDGSLNPPSYATPEWVEKLVFGGDHDGRGVGNSIKAHIEQNTYGTVQVSGEVYPDWVEISDIEKYRELNLTPTPDRYFAEEIVANLVASDPSFFNGKEFDFLIALTPGSLMSTILLDYQLYSKWPDPHGIFEGYALFDIPIDSSSQLYSTIYDEQRLSNTENIVVPRYNPQSVEGVWLASDTAHTGTNYYTGGSVRYDYTNPNYFAHFVKLGTPLPASNTEVVVTYSPRAKIRLSEEQMASAPPHTLPETITFGFMMHELYHGMGWLLTPNEQPIGDLYRNPQHLIEGYGLMSSGSWNHLRIGEQTFYVPANLSAYSKVNLDLVQPFTLLHNENEIGIRLYRSEEGNFTDTDSRIKVIKIPLHPYPDIGIRSLVRYPDEETIFSGEEYLLLEWRDAGELEGGAYNFDEALPHKGLMIYRVLENDSYIHGTTYQNIVRVIDATPPPFPFYSLTDFMAEGVYSMDSTAAPYGHDSVRYEYVAEASWNWKVADLTHADFLLSSGPGPKTVYAKYMDLNGEIVDQSSITITFEQEQNQMPVADAGVDQTIVDDGDGQEWALLDGGNSYDPDGTLVDYVWSMSGTVIAEGSTVEVNFEVGEHVITLEVYDAQGASDSSEVLVSVVAQAIAPIADAGEDVVVTDIDGNGIEAVRLDGSQSFDEDGTVVSYEWYNGATLIASGASVEIGFEPGVHDILLSVTDDSGQVSTDSLVVEVREGAITAPENLTADVAKSEVALSWEKSNGNVYGYYVERGQKEKRNVKYTRVAATDAAITQYLESLPAGTYYLRVQAFGLQNESNYSKSVQVRIKK